MLKKVQELSTNGLPDWNVIESQDHVCHPGAPLLWSDFETEVGFAKAQPPPALTILARSAEKLREERRELRNGAGERCAGKQRTEQGVALNTRVEGYGESAARVPASCGFVEI